MAKLLNSSFLLILILNLVFGFQVYAVPYDHTFTRECLAQPHGPQYGGGIVVNPELNDGLKGWTTFGDAKVGHGDSLDGNKYIVASRRNQSFHSLAQEFNLEKEKLYTFSAWLQVSHGSADIAAIFKTESSYEIAGWATAQKSCWSMLKGGLVVNATGPAHLYFETNNTEVDIWADSISLQPFTHKEWESHQYESIEKVRKRIVKFQAVYKQGKPISNATVIIKQKRPNFPLGCAINQNILSNNAYKQWFLSRFRYTVFEDELKWYSTERSRGVQNYNIVDTLVRFANIHGLFVRGQNVFWDGPGFQPSWVGGLSPNRLLAAAEKRINYVMRRYLGRFFHWDVVNKNLHFNFFESKLGGTASTLFYETANKIDPRTTPFLNEFNTIEDSRDGASSPAKYLQKIQQLRQQGYRGPLGIGLEGHFISPNLPYIRSAIDTLASARLPIWVTELDVAAGPNQAAYLEQILREVFAHFSVQGIIIWSAWKPQGCYKMCLPDNNFRNLATGNVVDRFRRTFSHEEDLQATTDANGFFETSLFHGEYEAKISHPNGDGFADLQKFDVLPNKEAPDTTNFKIDILWLEG